MNDLELTTRERLLIVHDPADLAHFVRERYPQFEVAVCSTYLAGIAELASRPARGLLVGADPMLRKLDSAVGGLRKAAGASARLVLCCHPSSEPIAREALPAGADDYVIYPPTGEELDQALGLPCMTWQAGAFASAPTLPTWDELTRLAGILAGLGEGRKPMLDRLCRLLADSMRTANVQIIINGDAAWVGDPNAEPAVVEAIGTGKSMLGRIMVGSRQRTPYSAGEIEKMRHYSRLIAHLLEAAQAHSRWQELAMIDDTTSLPNRRYLMRSLENLLAVAATKRSRVTVLIFDLDGFKHFNDTYGHGAGDEILRETGNLFRQHCRKHDLVARYAGDEFVVVFWDAEQPRVLGSKHPTDALLVLRRFRKALESHQFPKLGPEGLGCITISGGLASFPWDASTAEGLIQRADEALLKAKQAGKNRIYLVGSENNLVEEPRGDA